MNIVITGVSTGLGEAITQACIDKGYLVFGTVRTEADAEECSKKWSANFISLKADLREESDIKAIVERVANKLNGQPLDILINNAGVAKPGPLQYQPVQELQEMMNVNVIAPIRVTQAFLPLMQVRHNNRKTVQKIINISSVAGKISAPFLGGYAASKHAVEGFTNSLRRELMPWGIKVVIVAPGNVITPIWKKASSSSHDYNATPYENSFKRFIDFALKEKDKGMLPEEIAEVVTKIIASDSPKTRYAPVAQKVANWYLPRLLPDATLDKMMFKLLGMKSEK